MNIKEYKAILVVNQVIIVLLSLALALTWHVAVIFPIVVGVAAICFGVKEFRELWQMIDRGE